MPEAVTAGDERHAVDGTTCAAAIPRRTRQRQSKMMTCSGCTHVLHYRPNSDRTSTVANTASVQEVPCRKTAIVTLLRLANASTLVVGDLAAAREEVAELFAYAYRAALILAAGRASSVVMTAALLANLEALERCWVRTLKR